MQHNSKDRAKFSNEKRNQGHKERDPGAIQRDKKKTAANTFKLFYKRNIFALVKC